MPGPNGPSYPVTPVFTKDIPSLQNTDPASATDIFNPWITPIIDNISTTKLLTDALTGISVSGVVPTRAALPSAPSLPNDTMFLVQQDETRQNATTIYKTASGAWVFVQNYTITGAIPKINPATTGNAVKIKAGGELEDAGSAPVLVTRRVNNKTLNADITLTPADVGAEPAIPTGGGNQFWTGLKSWQDLAGTVRSVVLGGLSTATNAAVTTSDTILSGIGKLQAQINGLITSLNSKANLASPAFTGTPTAPTAAAGTNTNQVATMAAIYNSMVQQNVTYYLSPTGNDNNAGTSAATAWRTWGKAASAIPKALNGYDVTLQVAGGSYPEAGSAIFRNIMGGTLFIQLNGNVTFTGSGELSFYRCANVELELNTYTFSLGNVSLIAGFNTFLIINGSTNSAIQMVANSVTITYGLYASRNSQICFTSSATTLNITGYTNAIGAVFSIIRLAGTVYGSNNNYAFNAGGGLIQGPPASTHSITATQMYATSNGGRILFGAQTSIPNY